MTIHPFPWLMIAFTLLASIIGLAEHRQADAKLDTIIELLEAQP